MIATWEPTYTATEPIFRITYASTDCTCNQLTIGSDWPPSGANVIFIPAPEVDEREELRAWHRALSRQAAWEAQVALRSAPDDPGVRVPLLARKRPYVRQRAKKRVCAGSSRYRVLVN